MALTAISNRVLVPDAARKPCDFAPLPPMPKATEPEIQSFALLQSGFLQVCEGRRALGVYAADVFNTGQDRLAERIRPAKGFERLFGKRLPPLLDPDAVLAEPEVRRAR